MPDGKTYHVLMSSGEVCQNLSKDTNLRSWRNNMFSRLFRKLRETMRKNKDFNRYENVQISIEYYKLLKSIKDRNFKIVFDTYYYPQALSQILREDNYLATEDAIRDRAAAMLLQDKAKGILDNFYRFN